MIDFIRLLLRSEDLFYKGMWYNSILVNIDHLTKYIYLELIRMDSTAEQMVYLINRSVIINYRVLKQIIIDRDI